MSWFFRCAMCHEECDLKDYAFSFTVSDEDGVDYQEGVCGWCAHEGAP